RRQRDILEEQPPRRAVGADPAARRRQGQAGAKLRDPAGAAVNLFLQFTVDGLVMGALLALVGLGTVIVFRATNVLNFSQAGMMTFSGYVASRVSAGRVDQYWLGLVLATL